MFSVENHSYNNEIYLNNDNGINKHTILLRLYLLAFFITTYFKSVQHSNQFQ